MKDMSSSESSFKEVKAFVPVAFTAESVMVMSDGKFEYCGSNFELG